MQDPVEGTEVSTSPLLLELIREAIADVHLLRGRALLALIGIAIGTAAVIAMLHIGHTARVESMRRFQSLGIDRLSIVAVGTATRLPAIPESFVHMLLQPSFGIASAAPIVSAGTTLHVGRQRIGATLIASNDQLFELAKADFARGRAISDLDGFAPFVVLGAGIAREVRAATGQEPGPGDQIRIQDQIMTVVGVLEPTEQNFVLNLDLSRSVVIPLMAARRLVPASAVSISRIAAKFSAGVDGAVASSAIAAAFRQQVPQGGALQIQTARQLIASVDEQVRIYSLLLLAIGAVSLIVGGVGVMNVMLMSVMERRREIGVRIAIGARQQDIVVMFLTESMLLSAIGAVVGTIIGSAVGFAFAKISGWTFSPAWAALPLGVGMSVCVGLFFGLYPAVRAANLNPIDALRAE